MKIRLFLLIFLLLQVISCEPEDYYRAAYITIINNSEHNITWVTVVNAKTGYPAVSDRHDKLIEKDSSKTFEIWYEVGDYDGGDYTVCLKTEGTSEFMCVAKFSLNEDQKISFIWGGDNSSIWLPR